MALRDYIAGEIAEDYSDGRLSRREALRRLGLVGLTLTSATALLAACGGDDGEDETSGASTTSRPPRPTGAKPVGGAVEPAEAITFAGPDGELQGAWAAPASAKGGVLLVHEIFGLTPHFFDLAGRFAAEGYGALAVDLLSAQGGTSAVTDAGGTSGALAAAPLEQLLGDLGAGIDELERRLPGAKIGVVGFCYGGGMVWNLLNSGEDRLAAAIPFYGPAPADADFGGVRAAVLGVYGENDARVNATRDAATAALEAAEIEHEIKTYPGAGHGFFNDASPNYHEQAATQANADVLDWLDRHLT